MRGLVGHAPAIGRRGGIMLSVLAQIRVRHLIERSKQHNTGRYFIRTEGVTYQEKTFLASLPSRSSS
jgi:hypothetical protein